jgi:tagaturonate reductase
MKMRNIPVLVRYFEVFGAVPENIATGFAAYLLFMRSVKQQGNQYYASFNGKEYQLQDDHAAYFFEKWQQPPQDFIKEVLQDVVFWGEDLSKLPGFSEAVQEKLQQMMEEGVRATILSLQSKKILA